MADTKITALAAITTVDPAADVLPIVDVNDTSMAASGTTKKVTTNQLLGANGIATLASATISGDLTVDTSTLKVDSTNNRVVIGTLGAYGRLTIGVGSGLQAGTTTNAATSLYDIDYASTGDINTRLSFVNSNGVTNAAIDRIGNPYFNDNGVLSFLTKSGAGALTERYRIASDGVATWSVGGSTAMTLNSTGLGIGVAPSVGKGCLQLSSGINFPATQVASSDANTLDDYEEGTWTPSVGGTATYSTQTGRYVKIGNRVYITLRMTINVIGTGDDYRISGLPFQPVSTLAAASVGFFANLKVTANFISGYASTVTPIITITGTTAASANITNGIGVFGNSSDIVMSCFYEV